MNPKLNSIIFILIWVCSIYCTPKCFAQYFQRACDINGNADFAFHVTETNDKNLLVLGVSEWNFARPTVFCMKLSADGSRKMDSSFITDPVQSYFTAPSGIIKKLSGSRGYLLNITRQTPSTPPYYNSTEYGIARLDTNGQLLFKKFYTDTNTYVGDFYDIDVMPDGGYLLGIARAERATDMRECLLIRTDSLGNKLWEKVCKRNSSPMMVNSLEVLSDNKILFGTFISTFIQLPIPQHNYYRNTPIFTLMDTAGNVLKDALGLELPNPNKNVHTAGGGFIHKDLNGGYYHFGQIDSIDGSNYYIIPYFAHLDSNFKINWIKTLLIDSFFYSLNPWSTIQLKDSNYLLVGTRIIPFTIGWAAKIDKKGGIIWQHDYTLGSSDAYLTKAIERDNGTILMVGMYRGGQPFYEQDAFIVSVDSNGCLQPGCDPTSVQEVAVKGNNVVIYPNPVSEQLNISGIKEDTKISIYDLSGSKLYESIFTNKAVIDMLGFPCGVYLIQLESNSGFIERKKIVKQ